MSDFINRLVDEQIACALRAGGFNALRAAREDDVRDVRVDGLLMKARGITKTATGYVLHLLNGEQKAVKHARALPDGTIIASTHDDPAFAPLERGSFRTAGGSIYRMLDRHRTQRLKAKLWGHTESGERDPSDLTIYVAQQHRQPFSDAANMQGGQPIIELHPKDRHVGVLWKTTGRNWRPFSPLMPFRLEPEVGWMPVELWKIVDGSTAERVGYASLHPGHPVVEINR